MQTYIGANYSNMQRHKTCKHSNSQKMQTYKGAKHANMQKQKTCEYAKG